MDRNKNTSFACDGHTGADPVPLVPLVPLLPDAALQNEFHVWQKPIEDSGLSNRLPHVCLIFISHASAVSIFNSDSIWSNPIMRLIREIKISIPPSPARRGSPGFFPPRFLFLARLGQSAVNFFLIKIFFVTKMIEWFFFFPRRKLAGKWGENEWLWQF